MAFGTRVLKYWVLGPFKGMHSQVAVWGDEAYGGDCSEVQAAKLSEPTGDWEALKPKHLKILVGVLIVRKRNGSM